MGARTTSCIRPSVPVLLLVCFLASSPVFSMQTCAGSAQGPTACPAGPAGNRVLVHALFEENPKALLIEVVAHTSALPDIGVSRREVDRALGLGNWIWEVAGHSIYCRMRWAREQFDKAVADLPCPSEEVRAAEPCGEAWAWEALADCRVMERTTEGDEDAVHGYIFAGSLDPALRERIVPKLYRLIQERKLQVRWPNGWPTPLLPP